MGHYTVKLLSLISSMNLFGSSFLPLILIMYFNYQIKESFSMQYFLHYSHWLLPSSVSTTNMDAECWFEFVTVGLVDLLKIS